MKYYHIFDAALQGSTDIPRDVLLPIELDWREALEDFLNEMGTNRTRLYCPQKGDKRRQIELAIRMP